MADRLLNYLSVFILIVLFVLYADPTQRIWILVALGLSIIAVTITLLNNSLSIDGAAAALVVGTMAMGLGGITGTVLLLFFFFSSYGWSWWLDHRSVTRMRTGDEPGTGSADPRFDSSDPVGTGSIRHTATDPDHPGFNFSDTEEPGRSRHTMANMDVSGRSHRVTADPVSERRKGIQVWSNAFWFILFLILYLLIEDYRLLVVAVAAITAATSDTWSSVTGIRLAGRPRLITTFQKVPAGTDGAVSGTGFIAGLAAAVIMAILFLIAERSLDLRVAAIIMISGFSGCVVDSYLGAIFQYHRWMHRTIPLMKKYQMLRSFKILLPNNDSVNFLATGIAALIAFLLY